MVCGDLLHLANTTDVMKSRQVLNLRQSSCMSSALLIEHTQLTVQDLQSIHGLLIQLVYTCVHDQAYSRLTNWVYKAH